MRNLNSTMREYHENLCLKYGLDIHVFFCGFSDKSAFTILAIETVDELSELNTFQARKSTSSIL